MAEIETEEQVQVKTLESEERQTIVHCIVPVGEENFAYRVWPSTYLVEHGTGKRAKLIAAYKHQLRAGMDNKRWQGIYPYF